MTNKALFVRDLMTKDLILLNADMEIRRAVAILVEQDISGSPVVDDSKKLIGILTERDCINAVIQAGYFDEFGGSVSKYMSTMVETVSPNDSMMDIAERLINSTYRRFPVVENDQLVGLISRRDILRAFSQSVWFNKQENLKKLSR